MKARSLQRKTKSNTQRRNIYIKSNRAENSMSKDGSNLNE
jgi:hypothetical protein